MKGKIGSEKERTVVIKGTVTRNSRTSTFPLTATPTHPPPSLIPLPPTHTRTHLQVVPGEGVSESPALGCLACHQSQKVALVPVLANPLVRRRESLREGEV